MKRVFCLLTVFLGMQISSQGHQRTLFITNTSIADTNIYLNKSNLFTQEASYVGDFARNLTGGKKRGAAYLGMANLKIGFLTEKIGLWKGGEIFANGAVTHGGTPSCELLGDFQVASNLEAGNHIYLHELWYKHSAGIAEITIGIQDLNAEFVNSETGSLFLNSSLGIPSLIANNIPAPIFPLTSLGIAAKFQLEENVLLQAALFDGLPEHFERNQYNLAWDLDGDNGALIFSELQLSNPINNLPGKFKIGGYYHSKLLTRNEETGISETVFNNNYGFYLIADQTIWKDEHNRGLGVFAQFAVSPKGININNYYLGCGINYRGIFSKSCDDVLGLGIAHAGLAHVVLNNTHIDHETTIEFFYRALITENLFVQPDFQYIINPSGTERKLDNAVVAFVRFGINL